MEVNDVREVIASALEQLQRQDVKVVRLGNRVHLFTGEHEFEIVIRTMNPKGTNRLAKPDSAD
ncbi:MAG: hypothetical protein AB7L09_01030 [Nitrospira sp.]